MKQPESEAFPPSPNTMLFRTCGTITKTETETEIEIPRNYPKLRLDERSLVLQRFQKELSNPEVRRLDFIVGFERGELNSEPRHFSLQLLVRRAPLNLRQ